jgi:hypothetical protein
MKHALGIVLLALAGQTHAAGLGVRAGTTGLGVDYGWGVLPTLGARVGFSALKFNTDVDSGNVDYDAKLKIGMLSGLLDWSPLGPFRVSAGLVGGSNKIDVNSQTASFTVNGTTHTGRLSGTVKPGHSVSPYLGVGYGNVWTKGVNFYVDAGIVFQGSPKVDLTCTGSGCAAAQGDIEAEERKLADELKRYKYYPVFNVGITIGF